MVIIGIASFPTNSSTEAGNRFRELPALAGFITRRGPYILNINGEGFQSLSVYEFENSKMAEAMINLGNYYAAMSDIPGCTYSINTYFEIQEALSMIGLA